MSAGGPPPVRASANGSGPDPADGSKGDATVADRTQVDSPDPEAAGAMDVAAPSHDEPAGASGNGEVVATADDQVDLERPDETAGIAQPDGRADGEGSDDSTEADQVDDAVEAAASDDEEPAANAGPESVSVAAAAADDETVEQTGDRAPDPIEVASRFAESVPEPASLFVRPDKARPSSAVVPEQVAVELPTLAPVDEVTMPEMASMVPEPDLHLRPAFQQHQYGTVSAFRAEDTAGATVPISPGWPGTAPIAEPYAPTSEDNTPSAASASQEATAGSASAYPEPVPLAPARPVPVPPVASEPIASRSATVTPLSPTPTRPPLESPPAPQPSTPAPETRRPPGPAPAPTPTPSRPTQPRRRPRRARLRLSRVDPWSVAKIALLFSVAMAITTLITVSLLWGALNLMGVFTDVGQTVSEVTGSTNGGGIDVETMLSLSRVLKFATIIVTLQAIVLTCLATLAAFLYNASSGLVGGVEITLSEAE
ncbi:MAG: DUF3566 domain-containing protein [Actinomycetes bacterium]